MTKFDGSNRGLVLKTWDLPKGGVREAEATPQEMQLLFAKLPQDLSQYIQRLFQGHELMYLNEIYLQLGQQPECIFCDPRNDGKITRKSILDRPCTEAEINIFGSFFSDESGLTSKRRGIAGTLHRVSLITKPSSVPVKVLGVTVRVGRAMVGLLQTMTGGSSFLEPLAHRGSSLLLIGKPGVGKTTALREIASILSQDPSLRVVVVDKSLEIAGDADVPHPAIGKSRWMPVGVPGMQHEIMLEAVENQSPDVVIVDEISNDKEVRAAQTIAQRGVMLIATVHGSTIAELIMDRERSALVGGCSTVTLSGREADRRSDKKKQVLKRSKEPVFQTALELCDQKNWIYHNNVAAVVDDYLDKEDGTAVLLQPGRATELAALPVDGQLEYCCNCHSGYRCDAHPRQNRRPQPSSRLRGSHPFGGSGKKKGKNGGNKGYN